MKPNENIENNQLNFHIDQLLRDKNIEKVGSIYKLTPKGKEFANRMDTDTTVMKRQGKIGCIQCCIRTINNEPEFLVYTRLKHPFYGSQGYSSGKVDYGERTIDCSKRELFEETGLVGEPELFRIEHQIVYNKETNELLEDKYFYFHKFLNPTGEIKPSEEGLFEWVPESKLATYITKPFESVERILMISNLMKQEKVELTYLEMNHYADNF
jgi:ADP-ribose pyrophosphatase YjhB (NUDIX family)